MLYFPSINYTTKACYGSSLLHIFYLHTFLRIYDMPFQTLLPNVVFKFTTFLCMWMVLWRQYPANEMQPHNLPIQTACSQLA